MNHGAESYPTSNAVQQQPPTMPYCYVNSGLEADDLPPSYESVVQNSTRYFSNASATHSPSVMQPSPLYFDNRNFPPYDHKNTSRMHQQRLQAFPGLTRQCQQQQQFEDVTLRDYTIPAWIVCLCCCWPLGLAAVHYAYKSKTHLNSGQIVEAKEAGRKALNFIIATIILGIVVMGLSIVLRIVV